MMNIAELLTRGVDTIYPGREQLEQRLASGQPITLYLGIDPTGGLIHLGHTVALRKLAQFQQAGHKVILLIGDFTARIGDPSGKDKTRVPLTAEQVLANAKDYQAQASKILDFDHPTNPVRVLYNSSWLSKLTFEEVIRLAAHFTAQQMLERDMFERRLQENKPIFLHEFFYPLMQGYDSVAMDVDLEIGGTDQTFNMLAGRTLQREIRQREKFVLTVPILADARGIKIGKSEGNVIAITAEPNDLYGKVMSLSDDVIIQTFILCTNVPMADINTMTNQLQQGANPRDLKMRLAREIVTLYHSAEAAHRAEQEFTTIFAGGGKPATLPTQPCPHSTQPATILVELQLAASKAEAQRLIIAGGVRLNDQVLLDWKQAWTLKPGDIIQVGKRHFVQLT